MGSIWVAGKFGNGLAFDGVDDRVQIADSDTLDIPSAITLAAWVKRSADKPKAIIAAKESVTGQSYALWVATDRIVGHFVLNGTAHEVISSPIPLNNWTHAAVTYNGGTMRLYVNGAEVDTHAATGAFENTNASFWIGGAQATSDYFNGEIDDVQLHDRAFSVADISEVVLGTLSPPTIEPASGSYGGAVLVRTSSAHTGANRPLNTLNDGEFLEYQEPGFELTTTTTVRAFAFHPDYAISSETVCTYTVDFIAPTIIADPFPGVIGTWTNTPVTVTFRCSDASGIGSCSPPVTVDRPGALEVITGTAVDLFGNEARTPE